MTGSLKAWILIEDLEKSRKTSDSERFYKMFLEARRVRAEE